MLLLNRGGSGATLDQLFAGFHLGTQRRFLCDRPVNALYQGDGFAGDAAGAA